MRSEFEFIQHIKKKFSLDHVGDDCAVLPRDDKTDMLVTSDMLVEDIDFRLEWTTPEFLGHRALAVSLSDIAAMGGEPKWAITSIGVPETIWGQDFVERFYKGWHELAWKFRVELVGGDISRTPDKLVIDSTVFGDVPKGAAVLRSGARPTDRIFVSGTLGCAAGGLRLLENGTRFSDSLTGGEKALIEKQLRPYPRVELGKKLRELKIVTSMIDISDGFSSDLMHVCQASGVGATITALPISDLLHESFGETGSMEMALHGGEDFELLFTVPEEHSAMLDGVNVTNIGAVTSIAGKVEVAFRGHSEILKPHGFQHF